MKNRLVCVTLALALLGAMPARADTQCSFGGPAPGWRAVRLDLPTGTPFVTLELPGRRSMRPVSDNNNWHLAEGIVVLREDTLAIEAYRLASWGMAPRSVVVAHDGQSVVAQPATTPDVPYVHTANRLRSGLPAGSYIVVAFGSDGGTTLPSETWAAAIQVSGTHSCAPLGAGAVFDIDQTEFTGGTQIYAPGIGHAEDITHSFTTSRSLVVGMMDAETQLRTGSSITLDYRTPTDAGTVSQSLQPFVSTAGAYEYRANYSGYSPLINIAGVTLDL